MRRAAFWRAAWAIAAKDIRAEARSRELVGLMGLFALIAVLIFSFALELNRDARVEAVNGVLWVTIVFAAILGLNRGIALEREGGGLEALITAPIDRSAIFVGKWIGGLFPAGIVAALLLPVVALLYNLPIVQPPLIAAIVLGTMGFTAIGTLLAALTAQTRARENLLPIVMLPITLPLLIAAVRASNGILNRTPDSQWSAWLGMLAALAVLFIALAFILFEYVIEE